VVWQSVPKTTSGETRIS